MTEKEAIEFLEAIKRGLHQTGKDHPYRDDLIPKMKEALCIAIEEMKAESCKDAISRKAALEAILTSVPDFCGGDEGGNLIGRNETASYIRNLPSVTPKQKTGEILTDFEKFTDINGFERIVKKQLIAHYANVILVTMETF